MKGGSIMPVYIDGFKDGFFNGAISVGLAVSLAAIASIIIVKIKEKESK